MTCTNPRKPAALLAFLGLAALLPAALASPNTTPEQPLPPGAVRGVATRNAEMRSVPDRAAPSIHHIPKGLSIAVFSMQNGFYAMQLRNGRQGYVPTDAIRLAQPLKAFGAHLAFASIFSPFPSGRACR